MTNENAIQQRQNALPPLSLIQAEELREMLGHVSDMWLWRKLKDGTLPKPLVISGRRFWRRDEIHEFIEQESAKRAPFNGAAVNG